MAATIDHIGFPVRDFARSKQFYIAALAPLGIALIVDAPAGEIGPEAHAGFGAGERAQFWISSSNHARGRVHVAFIAASREAVQAFHAAALQAGGYNNGAPGLRPDYHADYFAAFVLDPDGHNIEAVCHAAP